MSRSNPPRSPIAESLRQSSPSASSPPSPHRPFRRRLNIRVAAFVRWLHIYLSMFGLASVLFFGVTGLTLNHPDWFFAGAERSVQSDGKLDPAWLHPDAPASSSSPDEDADPSRQVAKLEIVEHLRAAHGIRGALADFRVDEGECLASFKGPGYSADAFIERDSGRYTVTQTFQGFIAVINDLHKGRDTGPHWSVLIDVSAAAMTLISLTGLVLIFYLKLRRVPGLVVALVGTIAVAAVYWLGVP
jgi:uncharacterized protein